MRGYKYWGRDLLYIPRGLLAIQRRLELTKSHFLPSADTSYFLSTCEIKRRLKKVEVRSCIWRLQSQIHLLAQAPLIPTDVSEETARFGAQIFCKEIFLLQAKVTPVPFWVLFQLEPKNLRTRRCICQSWSQLPWVGKHLQQFMLSLQQIDLWVLFVYFVYLLYWGLISVCILTQLFSILHGHGWRQRAAFKLCCSLLTYVLRLL